MERLTEQILNIIKDFQLQLYHKVVSAYENHSARNSEGSLNGEIGFLSVSKDEIKSTIFASFTYPKCELLFTQEIELSQHKPDNILISAKLINDCSQELLSKQFQISNQDQVQSVQPILEFVRQMCQESVSRVVGSYKDIPKEIIDLIDAKLCREPICFEKPSRDIWYGGDHFELGYIYKKNKIYFGMYMNVYGLREESLHMYSNKKDDNFESVPELPDFIFDYSPESFAILETYLDEVYQYACQL